MSQAFGFDGGGGGGVIHVRSELNISLNTTATFF